MFDLCYKTIKKPSIDRYNIVLLTMNFKLILKKVYLI